MFGDIGTGKVANGGGLPLLLKPLALCIVLSWHTGRMRLVEVGGRTGTSVARLARQICRREPTISPPLVALMRPGEDTVASIDQLRRILGVNPGRVVNVSVWVGSAPRVRREDRVAVVRLGDGICRIDLRVGYLQQIDLPSLLAPKLANQGTESDEVVYLVSHDRLVPPRIRGLSDLASVVFVILLRLAERTTDRFRLPPKRTLEIGVIL